MRTNILFAFPVAALIACGSSTTTPTPTPDLATTTPPADMAVFVAPTKPALAATQLDRMGRPTINVAVTNPFNLNYTGVGMGANGRDATRLAYNSDSNPAAWAANWTPVLAKTLAIYDGVDKVCGNQFAACGAVAGCAMGHVAAAGDYNTFASVLADDQLYMNTTLTNCGLYLGVELASLQVPGASATCGGRTPLVNVVDETYTAAVVGAAGFNANGTFAVTGGVTTKSTQASLTTFPFLTTPN